MDAEASHEQTKQQTVPKTGSSAKNVISAALFLVAVYVMAIYWQYTVKDNFVAFTVTKVLPCVIMGMIAAIYAQWLISIGLLLGAGGDLLLAFANQALWVTKSPLGVPLFAMGAFSFLLGHVAYIFFAVRLHRRLSLLHLLPFVAMVGAMLYKLHTSGNTSFAAVVPVYSLFISVMGWRTTAIPKTSGPNILIGLAGVLFAASDFTLGLVYFVAPVPHHRLIIMTTYWAAQTLFLLQGIMRS
ncbi:YhhN-like [Carpediemonas membranifera]|uniref:YhhN-like n=1 Tax=Carpediemonas membranifera TaxID=201153 RepID=A0A8J6DZN1_9EUKA|nr:YhhN-like [Carpediemonas membranifera]|eukprot:KAG9390968.1 YhhN-like [Carpediemonas membranifera]